MSPENLPCVAVITPDVCALAARRRGNLVAVSIHWGSLGRRTRSSAEP